MQKIILALILSLIITGANAQIKKGKANASVSKVSPEELIESYKFKEAATLINKEIQAAQRKQQSTEKLEELLVTANNGQNMLSSTEDVVFIDSVVVDKEKILEVYRISSESGKIDYLKNLMKGSKLSLKEANGIAYTPQLLDKIYYSSIKDSALYMFTRDRLDDQWGEAKQVQGLEDFGYDQITPFVLTDGATLYFAAKGEESLGGYDIFMSRDSQDQGTFLKPENIGMPFNSPSNDYLYVVDEANNLGWFASDRRQPEGKVCVYVFIPNETRKSYDLENFEDAIPNFAKINSIKATWVGENDRVKSALERLKNIFTEESRSGASSDFLFVINDSKIYTSLQDFKDAKAKGYASQWAEALKIYDSQKAQLDSEREVYSTADTEKRNLLKPQILAKEKEVEKLKASIKNLEKLIREEELKKQ